MVSNHKSKNRRGSSSLSNKPTCGKCCKKHYGDYLIGMDNYFSCGKSYHKLKDFPNLKGQDKGSGQAQASGSTVDPPKKNRFSSLRSMGEQECSPDVVIGTSQVFSIDVYYLLFPGATLSFVTPLVASKFDILSNILIETFMVSTPVGELVVAKRV